MLRPAAGRRVAVALATVCLVVLVPRLGFAQTPSQAAEDRRDSRLDRLEQWTTAVERHVPGRTDDALGTFKGWGSIDLSELASASTPRSACCAILPRECSCGLAA